VIETPIRSNPKPDVTESLDALRTRLNENILGKSTIIDLALTTLIAGGHLLLEDVPGVGKTTLARQIAGAFDGDFQRIQFTSDLLPMDVIGVQVYQRSTETFEFNQGPVFANFLLADEINRAAPKTQSSLLQAMNEREVSVDRQTHQLPDPFMVIATQNPMSFEGTHPLPESQLDRFMMTLKMGYPNRDAERQLLLRGDNRRESIAPPTMTIKMLTTAQQAAHDIHCDESVLGYIQDIVDATRTRADLKLGVSPRGALTLLRAAKAHALLNLRTYVTPHDVKTLVIPCLAHRVLSEARYSTQEQGQQAASLILAALLNELVVPT
jgi:MoxR-like ATPase